MKCVILQPSYIPWRGYFDQIQKADLFVFYDNVQYDTRGWRNRNRIKTKDGPQWLTIPVHSKGAQTVGIPINQIRIDWSSRWSRSHWQTIRRAYGKAPFFEDYRDLLHEFYERRPELLSDFVIDFTIAIADQVGITNTTFVRASSLPTEGQKSDQLLSILRHLGADHYISGPSAKAYLELEKFADIEVEFMEYDYPQYPQLHGDYEPQLSILDLLMMVGPDAPKYIWNPSGE